jgi:hypothetical protein
MNFFAVAIQNGDSIAFAGIQGLGIMFYLIDASFFNPFIGLKSRKGVVDALGINGQVFGRNNQVYHTYITTLRFKLFRIRYRSIALPGKLKTDFESNLL